MVCEILLNYDPTLYGLYFSDFPLFSPKKSNKIRAREGVGFDDEIAAVIH